MELTEEEIQWVKNVVTQKKLADQIKEKTDERDAKIIVEQDKTKVSVMDEYAPMIDALKAKLPIKSE